MQQGRSQARHLVVAAVDQPPSLYAEALEQGAGAASIHVVDLYSDPYGWQQQQAAAGQGQQQGAAEPLPLEQLQRMLLQQRQGQPGAGAGAQGPSAAAGGPADGAAAAGHQLCIAIDSLSTLMMRYPPAQVGFGALGLHWPLLALLLQARSPLCPPPAAGCQAQLPTRRAARPPAQVLQLLRSLSASPRASCALALLHEDLHDAQQQAALQRLASCCVRLQLEGNLERRLAGRQVLGAVDFR
jgi:hypothetical protein